MEEIILNKNNLNDSDIDIVKEKARALIVDSNDEIIVCNNNGVYILPGGKLRKEETSIEALKRELKEEIGIDYIDKEIVPFMKLIQYQKDYKTRTKETVNRKIITNIYVINSNLKVNIKNTNLTKSEKEDFNYIYANYNDIYDLLSQDSDNPRKSFFDKELETIINYYKKSNIIDLHTHTKCSDGEYSPKDLVSKAKENNINVLSICDHDRKDAYNERLSDNNILVIPGVEISCKVNKGQLHVLGYDYNINDNDFSNFLTRVKNDKIDNMIMVNESLYRNFGIKIDDDTINSLIDKDTFGRVFLAKELIKMGYVKSVKEGFDKYLIDSYEKVQDNIKGVSWEEAFYNIKKANGLVVLAHPTSLKISPWELYNMIGVMKYNGLDGIECYNQIYDNDDISFFQFLAKKYNLYQTIGSDFHGENIKPNVKLGNGSIDEHKVKKLAFVEEIKRRHTK